MTSQLVFSKNMNKEKVIAALQREFATVAAERRSAVNDPSTYAARMALRDFQSQRMARTHADLLAASESRAAAQYFLSDLYGAHDFSQRDANLERVIPTMERLLPMAALVTVADAIALDALSEKLDAAMARRLGERFTEGDYAAAYREVTSRPDRERQLDYVASVGNSLCDVVRVPLIGSMLAMMRGPAKLANLSELQSFLERGFKAFKSMRYPRRFVETIVQREQAILNRIYGGENPPFQLDIDTP